MSAIISNLQSILANSGFAQFFVDGGYRYVIMIAVACVLLYLAIVHQFEPLLLLPIGFGMLMANLPLDNIIHMEIFINDTQHINWQLLGESGGLADYLYLGVKLGIYPPLIFLGIGTMTDFEPLIARPSSLLMGAAAQLGIFVAYIGARLLGFTPAEAASIGIIGGADGPTAIFTTTRLAPALLGSVAVAAYCYMALVPVIQPPIMKLLTTDKERKIVMEAPRKVSRTEKILFPIIVTLLVSLLLPDAAILVGCLMMGNLMKETGVVERITKTAGNELMNIITIFLGFSVGCTTNAETFLNMRTVLVIVLGVVAFAFGTAGGVILGKIMCFVTKGKINPLIGSAGVSAVPMAARVSQKVGQEYNPRNYLLMHAMGPNVAGVIGSAVAAGILINMCQGM
ncbi:sodium ion-translocating decarboxylase subunit beta [uncultured Gemmiger sp.]|uniref:sodium ion-translocating decarboxylase subunit beta n=1 Tax=uncultured Gemmiger sp. TaxID=1623490 RepID=UPI0025DD8C90|nr:sodium ion-translocating decarboxylase subunit beta [uncultured Gemmiger sp.]